MKQRPYVKPGEPLLRNETPQCEPDNALLRVIAHGHGKLIKIV